MKFPGARRIPAILRGRTGRLPVSARKKDRSEAVWGSVSLASENRFPERWEGAARDSVRMRQRPVCMQEFREELGHDGQLGTLDRIAELLYCWCAPQMEHANKIHAPAGSIPSMRPVREPTSRTCDFHIRIKPSYPSLRTARGMTDGLPAHQSSPLQSAIHGRFANGRS